MKSLEIQIHRTEKNIKVSFVFLHSNNNQTNSVSTMTLYLTSSMLIYKDKKINKQADIQKIFDWS